MQDFHSFSCRIDETFQIKINHGGWLFCNEINSCSSLNYVIAVIQRNCKTVMPHIYCSILCEKCMAAYCKKKSEQEVTLSLIHISEPTRRTPISYAVFCLKKKKKI